MDELLEVWCIACHLTHESPRYLDMVKRRAENGPNAADENLIGEIKGAFWMEEINGIKDRRN